ncbi:MAG: hypothetical protein GC193_01370 [Cryomorphaceae bacterium]|nr:hypothetical protein [Cryomorphaceae bacterium]
MIRIILFALSIFVSAGALSQTLTDTIPYAELRTAKMFRSAEEALETPEPVYRLDLSGKRLKEIPPEVFELKYLQELILDKNKLHELPAELLQLKNLQRLSVSHNHLEEFPAFVCNLKNLRYIDFSDNEISKLPDEIHRLQKLEELILWSNIIGYYPGTMMRLTNLKLLDLMHNEMSINEQERIFNMFPDTEVKVSPPCNCTFDDEE